MVHQVSSTPERIKIIRMSKLSAQLSKSFSAQSCVLMPLVVFSRRYWSYVFENYMDHYLLSTSDHMLKFADPS